MKRIVIFGATSRIAQGCALLWVQRGDCVALIARNAARLDAFAHELRALPGAAERVATLVCDARDVARLSELPGEAAAAIGAVDGVLVAHGMLADQLRCQSDLEYAREAMDINGTSAALVAEAFAGALERQRGGFIAIIGSVAGDRGRQSNYAYGAAKGLVEGYAQGLRHRLHRSGVAVTLIKPGPTATPMTEGALVRVPLADPDRVARDIVAGIDARHAVVYTPRKWRWIMAIVRAMPEALFRRLDL